MHSLLENYLAQVEQQLNLLPVTRRNEELREMRQHLQDAAALNRERGQTEDEAVQAALEQFGTPETLSKKIIWAWRRGDQPENRRSFWGAAICTTVLSFLGAGMICVPASEAFLHSGYYLIHPWLIGTTVALMAAMMTGMTGWITGLAPRCPKRLSIGFPRPEWCRSAGVHWRR